jgi:hypothetical protein
MSNTNSSGLSRDRRRSAAAPWVLIDGASAAGVRVTGLVARRLHRFLRALAVEFRDFQAAAMAAILRSRPIPESCPVSDKTPDTGEKPEQTVITKEDWEARQLAAHLLGEHEDTEPLPTTTNCTAGKVTVLNPFNIPYGPTIDAEQKPKDCPLCGNVGILFPTNPSVQCCVCGCEVWGDTIDEALTRWNTRTASE